MEVHRFTDADLDSAASARPVDATSQIKTKADSGSNLRFGGSKTVKVGVGGNGGVALDQTLFLTAEGEISPGVKLKARLSDGDLPLSAQGSSASLREIDEMFVEVRSPTWSGRLGDQEWRLPGGLAPGFERRTRGLEARWHRGIDTVVATLGGAQAKWKRVTLQGSGGRQEGYVLANWVGGTHGVVVPGSERVRINGQAMKRGPDADYTVRYAEGLLDFTTHRRILSSDVIEAEFQSADMDYERAFAASRTTGTSGRLQWQAWAARESDDANRPLAYVPDSSSRRILREAGSDSGSAIGMDGQILALPSQTGEAGIRLRLGDSGTWIATDLRASDFDPNIVSSLDTRRSGWFGTASTGWRAGQHVGRGGWGRFSGSLRTQRLDARYHGLSATDTLGAASTGLWDIVRTGERTLAGGEGAWEFLPGIGLSTDLAGKNDASGWTTRSATRFGLDKSATQQILSGWEWIRKDDGLHPLVQTRSNSRYAWPLGKFAPSLELGTETRDRWTADSLGNQAWVNLVAGSSWRPATDLELGLFGNGRRDAIRSSVSSPLEDTARAIGSNTRLKWTPRSGDLDLEADWKTTRIRQIPSLPWIETQSWLGSATAGFWPWNGLRGTARWKLSSSSYQPEIARYDTVPAGTGSYRFDTLLRIVVPSDEGDLRPAGTRLDTTRPAVLASQRSLSGEVELEPRRLFPKLRGVLADLGGRLHADFEESDSSRTDRVLPHFDDGGLANSITGRSDLGGAIWWSVERKRLEISWNRAYAIQSSPYLARTREMTEQLRWTSATKSGHRLELAGAHGDLRDSQADRTLRLEEYWSADPSVAVRIRPSIEIRPGWYSKRATGSIALTEFGATLQAPYAGLRATLPRGLALQGEVRRVSAKVDALAGSRLSDGYPSGATWRASAGLEWSWKDHVQARADWLARKEPQSPWFQKLSLEAKAIF
jgi:hypothetical protein